MTTPKLERSGLANALRLILSIQEDVDVNIVYPDNFDISTHAKVNEWRNSFLVPPTYEVDDEDAGEDILHHPAYGLSEICKKTDLLLQSLDSANMTVTEGAVNRILTLKRELAGTYPRYAHTLFVHTWWNTHSEDMPLHTYLELLSKLRVELETFLKTH